MGNDGRRETQERVAEALERITEALEDMAAAQRRLLEMIEERGRAEGGGPTVFVRGRGGR